jgi:4-amino-4-deoxy-L-arabinose transferase-like glycosyltransferase
MALGVLLLGGATLFAGLGRYPLWEPDEARHAQIAHEIVEHGAWILPTFRGRPYRRKPILYYALTAGAYELGGVRTAMARVVSATAGLLTLLAVFVWARQVWGLEAAVLSALTLLTTTEFVVLGRYGDLNMLLTLWVTIGVLAVYRWARLEGRGAGLLVSAAACGLGALTKGLVAPILVGGIGLLHLWRSRRLGLLRRAQVALAAAVFVAVTAPWYVAVGLRAPRYLQEFFFNQHLHRVIGGGPGLHPEPFYFAIEALVVAFVPWTLLVPAALHRAVRGEHDDGVAFCLLWAAVVVLAFSLPSGKLVTYVLPGMPALALLVGRYGSELARRVPTGNEDRLLRLGTMSLAGLAVAAPPIALVAMPHFVGAVWLPLARLSVVLCPFGVVMAWVAATRRWKYTSPTIVAAILTACLVFYGGGASLVSSFVSDAPMARAIRVADPGRRAPVIAFRTYGGSLSFYLDRPVRYTDSTRRVRRVLARRPLVFIVTHRRHVRALRRMRELFVWRQARHLLVASRPPAGEDQPFFFGGGDEPSKYPHGNSGLRIGS